MRIAVMADIHSNHIALETCFAEAQRRNAEDLFSLETIWVSWPILKRHWNSLTR